MSSVFQQTSISVFQCFSVDKYFSRPAGCIDIYEMIVRLTICFVTHPFDFIAAEETIPKEATVGSSGKRGLARSTVQRVHGGWEHNLCARR
jgi:hypothetical protein